MRQQHHVVTLAAASWPTSPGEIAALANPEHTAQAMGGKLRFRPIDEREPHRLPSRTKKAVAFFRMSRSCRRISFSAAVASALPRHRSLVSNEELDDAATTVYEGI